MDFRYAKKKQRKRKRREDDEDYDFEAEMKKTKKTCVKVDSRANLAHLKELLKRSNFYANSLLNIITQQQKRRDKQIQRKLNKRKKQIKKITDKVKKDYGKKCKKVPQVYTVFLESEENQISFGEKVCFRVAVAVSHLVKKVNSHVKGDSNKLTPQLQEIKPTEDTTGIGFTTLKLAKPYAGSVHPAETTEEQREVNSVMDFLLDTICADSHSSISSQSLLQTPKTNIEFSINHLKKHLTDPKDCHNETPSVGNNAYLRDQKLNKCRRLIDMEPVGSDYVAECKPIMEQLLTTVCGQEDINEHIISHTNEFVVENHEDTLVCSDAHGPIPDVIAQDVQQPGVGETLTNTGNEVAMTDLAKNHSLDNSQPSTSKESCGTGLEKGQTDLLANEMMSVDGTKEEAAEKHNDEYAGTATLHSQKSSETFATNVSSVEPNPGAINLDSQSSQASASGIKVPCPICCKMVGETQINQHLDICLSGGERKESLRTKSNRSTSKRRQKTSKKNTKANEVTVSEDKMPTADKTGEISTENHFQVDYTVVKTEVAFENNSPGEDVGYVDKKQPKGIPNQEFIQPIKDEIKSNEFTEIVTVTKHEVKSESDPAKATCSKELEKIQADKYEESNESFTCNTKMQAEKYEESKESSTCNKKMQAEKYEKSKESFTCNKKMQAEKYEESKESFTCNKNPEPKMKISSLEDIIGYAERMEEDANESESEKESSSESENEDFVPPVELRRSTRVSRCKTYVEENTDEEMEDEEDEEDECKTMSTRQKRTRKSKEKNIQVVDTDMSIQEKYCVGDVIRVSWGQGQERKLYKANILDRCPTDDVDDWTYLIHYIGWNEAFDDWIFTSDIDCVLESNSDDVMRWTPGCSTFDMNWDQCLTREEQALLDEKFYMPGTCTTSALASLLTVKNGMRYFKDIAVSPAQPKLFTGGVLRSYQVTGYEWMKILIENGENGILADEMGLGKTIQCIAIICKMIEVGVHGPFLICAPMSTIQNWFLEFRRFAPKIPLLLYHGNAAEREMLSLCIAHKDPKLKTRPVVITTYDVLMRDRMILQIYNWSYMIIDEGHRIKNLKCKLLKELHYIRSQAKLLLTGTPLQNNLSELWSLLNFLLPEVFDDLKTFETWFNIDRLRKDQNLLSVIHKILTPFLLRRMKCDVELNLPPKKEVIVYAPLSSKQERFYRGLVDQSIRELVQQKEYYNTTLGVADPDLIAQKQNSQEFDSNSNPIKNSTSKSNMKMQAPPNLTKGKIQREKIVQNFSLSNTIMQLRKCCNHPYLLEYPCDADTGDLRIDDNLVNHSGKLMILDQLLPRLKAGDHKVLLFSQMTRMLDILEDYCFMRDFRSVRLDGQMKRDDRVDSISTFSSDPGVFIFLLSTRAGGLGINLTAADTVILYDSDWNPQNDAQAQDRCHRIGQERPVVVYRLVTANTVDQQIVERASKKMALEKIIMHKALFKGNLEQELTDKNKIHPEELLQLLESSKDMCKAEKESDEIISAEELEKLLDRSDMIK